MTRGYTLIELMISVAIVGIVAALAGGDATRQIAVAQVEVERAQALVLLEYYAEALSAGRELEPGTLSRLTAPLRDADIERSRRAGTTTVTVSWTDPLGRTTQRALTVFSAEGR